MSSATRMRASLPTVVVFPVPFTPTIRTTAGLAEPSTSGRSRLRERSIEGSTRARSSSRRISRMRASSVTDSTATRRLRASISVSVASRPRSAMRRDSSISSQSAAPSWPRLRTPRIARPSEPEDARRSRRRSMRPRTGSGRSMDEAGVAGASGLWSGVGSTASAGPARGWSVSSSDASAGVSERASSGA